MTPLSPSSPQVKKPKFEELIESEKPPCFTSILKDEEVIAGSKAGLECEYVHPRRCLIGNGTVN